MVCGVVQGHSRATPLGEAKEQADLCGDLEPSQHKGGNTSHPSVRSLSPAQARKTSVGEPTGGPLTPRVNGKDAGGGPPCFQYSPGEVVLDPYLGLVQ